MSVERTFGMIQSTLFDSPEIDTAPRVVVDRGGSVTYDRYYFNPETADELLKTLLAQGVWKQNYLKMYGREIAFPRLTAWYGEKDAAYKYSGVENEPLPWLPILRKVRDRLYQDSKVKFNSVLLNLYRNGDDSLSWHADDERELGNTPVIASISLGASRTFQLRSCDDRKIVTVELEHGSLLLMSGETQRNWEHRVPKQKDLLVPRINLTFRVVLARRNEGAALSPT